MSATEELIAMRAMLLALIRGVLGKREMEGGLQESELDPVPHLGLASNPDHQREVSA